MVSLRHSSWNIRECNHVAHNPVHSASLAGRENLLDGNALCGHVGGDTHGHLYQSLDSQVSMKGLTVKTMVSRKISRPSIVNHNAGQQGPTTIDPTGSGGWRDLRRIPWAFWVCCSKRPNMKKWRMDRHIHDQQEILAYVHLPQLVLLLFSAVCQSQHWFKDVERNTSREKLILAILTAKSIITHFQSICRFL